MAARSFEAKVNLGIYVTLALFIPIIGLSAYLLHYVIVAQQLAIQNRGEQVILAERLRSELRTQQALMPIFVLSPSEKLVRHIDDSHSRFREIVHTLQTKYPQNHLDTLIQEIAAKEDSLFQLAQPMIQKRLNGESAAAATRFFNYEAGAESEIQSHRVNQIVEQKTADLFKTKRRTSEAASYLLRLLALVTFICLAFAAAIAFLMTKLTRQKRQLDIQTEERLTEEERHSRARKEILEVVSHDLKNPLSTMKMATEILEEEFQAATVDHEAMQETLEIAKRSIHSMDRLIKDLLDNAKIDSGSLSLEYSSSRLHALTSQLSDPLKPLAKAKGIELVTVFENEDAEISCDRDRVAQVFSNLLGNAIKFTPENGKIWISAEQHDEEALISIRDTGTGIPQEQLPHIFDRYWQVRETAAQGTGLGLAIVKGIIEAHGTKIWAESEPGHGTKFSFTLPLHARSDDPLQLT